MRIPRRAVTWAIAIQVAIGLLVSLRAMVAGQAGLVDVLAVVMALIGALSLAVPMLFEEYMRIRGTRPTHVEDDLLA